MKPRQYFPLGKAYGAAFCNRADEIKELIGNLENGTHTFLAAPRRYGKSSLCEQVIHQMSLPHTLVDLYIATSEKSVERHLLKGVLEIIGQAVGAIDKAVQSLKYTFKNLKPKFSLSAAGMKLDFDIEDTASSPEAIREMLLFLDKLLVAKKKRAIFVIDEFQRVMEIAAHMGIEGAIRSAAQETQNLAFIFSGSNRHLIETIFQDEARPLYKLCKKIKLERISEGHYKRHLNKAAVNLWGENLNDAAFMQIMQVTERHPYYVNYLCDYLWAMHNKEPSVADVNAAWIKIIEEEKSDLLKEYFSIPDNQKKLLRYIALHPEQSLYTVEASKKMEIPTTSIPYALNALINKDLIELWSSKHYHVINPAFMALLAT